MTLVDTLRSESFMQFGYKILGFEFFIANDGWMGLEGKILGLSARLHKKALRVGS